MRSCRMYKEVQTLKTKLFKCLPNFQSRYHCFKFSRLLPRPGQSPRSLNARHVETEINTWLSKLLQLGAVRASRGWRVLEYGGLPCLTWRARGPRRLRDQLVSRSQRRGRMAGGGRALTWNSWSLKTYSPDIQKVL